jgi:hypothetical protein
MTSNNPLSTGQDFFFTGQKFGEPLQTLRPARFKSADVFVRPGSRFDDA